MVAAPCWGWTTLSPTLYREVALPGLGGGGASSRAAALVGVAPPRPNSLGAVTFARRPLSTTRALPVPGLGAPSWRLGLLGGAGSLAWPRPFSVRRLGWRRLLGRGGLLGGLLLGGAAFLAGRLLGGLPLSWPAQPSCLAAFLAGALSPVADFLAAVLGGLLGRGFLGDRFLLSHRRVRQCTRQAGSGSQVAAVVRHRSKWRRSMAARAAPIPSTSSSSDLLAASIPSSERK